MVSQKNLPSNRYLSLLIPQKAHMKEVQCCMAKVAVMSLRSSRKQINVGREEFAYNPACVFAFVLRETGES